MDANKKIISDSDLESVTGGTVELCDRCMECPNCDYYTTESLYIKLPAYDSDDWVKKCPKCGGAWPYTLPDLTV